MTDSKISKKEIKRALISSGYLLESRIASVLNRAGYFVETNFSFPDPESGKSREIDLFADYRGVHFHSNNIYVSTYLAIEAINNPHPVVFFKSKSYNLNPLIDKIRFVTTPPYSEEQNHFLEELNLEDFHHIGTADISSQYCSFSKKKNQGSNITNQWMASHTDALHDIFKKLLQFVDYKVKEHSNGLSTVKDDKIRCLFYQPVLVVASEIFQADALTKSVALKKLNQIEFEFNYHYQTNPSTIIIDVVTEPHFPAYLELVQDEASKTGRRIEILVSDSGEKIKKRN